MNENEQLIRNFYSAFQNKDYKTMQESYADNAVFSDPVFKNITSEQVKSMWEMFCLNGKDLTIEISQVSASEFKAQAKWKASYIFSATGRKVVNHVKANFVLENGKILSHTDHSNFYKWTCQALGLKGILLGWTPIVKNKIRIAASRNLDLFMKRNR